MNPVRIPASSGVDEKTNLNTDHTDNTDLHG
jgi:hypothetical protein